MHISDWSSEVCSSDLIEHRQWQEVDESQIDGDEGGEEDQRADPQRRHLARLLGDLDRSAHVLDRTLAGHELAEDAPRQQIGRASCRERVGQFVSVSAVTVSLTNTTKKNIIDQS